MNSSFKMLLLVCAIATGVSACKTTGSKNQEMEQTYNHLATKTAFDGGVVGKTLFIPTKPENKIIISNDGTWTGMWNGKKIDGEWTWEDGYWCRTITGGEQSCQKYEMSSTFDTLRVTRDKGKGSSWIYKMSY